MKESERSGLLLRHLVAYALMLAAAAAAFLLIRSHGEALVAPHVPEARSGTAPAQPHVMLHVLLAMLAVVLMSRPVSALFRLMRQPPVIAEVVSGVMLGPSLLGSLAPDVTNFL